MYCSSCGKKIDEDSKFCQFCGVKIISDVDTPKKEQAKKVTKKEDSTPQALGSSHQPLWDKFVEIHDAKDKEKEKFDDMTSLNVWDFLDRISRNSFEQFIQENKEELNTQSYRTIEALQTLYNYTAVGGYKLWLAEALLNKGKVGRLLYISIDDLVEDWKKEDFNAAVKEISEQMGICMEMYQDYRLKNFMEAAPSARDLTNATVEKLKQSLLWQLISGYLVGKIESQYRR